MARHSYLRQIARRTTLGLPVLKPHFAAFGPPVPPQSFVPPHEAPSGPPKATMPLMKAVLPKKQSGPEASPFSDAKPGRLRTEEPTGASRIPDATSFRPAVGPKKRTAKSAPSGDEFHVSEQITLEAIAWSPATSRLTPGVDAKPAGVNKEPTRHPGYLRESVPQPTTPAANPEVKPDVARKETTKTCSFLFYLHKRNMDRVNE